MRTLCTSVFLAGFMLSGSIASAKDLTIAGWGGSYQAAQRAALFEPFADNVGIKIIEDQHNGDIARLKAMVQAGSVTWDVVSMYKFSVIQGCDEGILEPLDSTVYGNKDDYMPGALHPCGVASDIFANIIAYDQDRMGANPPTTLADFFDVQKYPGKRGLKRAPQGNLEFALLADGVEPAEVYNVLATKEGQDRAFSVLDRIRLHVVWWQAGAQPPQLLADGEVVMTTAYNGRIYSANVAEGRHFKIIWDGQVYEFDYWAIPKGTPNVELAKEFLRFATQPRQMAKQAELIPYGPPRKSAMPMVPEDVKVQLPTEENNLRRALAASPEFWGDNFESINDRFQAWLAQ